MSILSKISPAETYLVLKGEYSSLKELLKYTLMDLLLKQVLTTIEVKKSHLRELRTYKYIVIGKKFHSYIPKPHELVFLTPFNKNNSVKILFKHIVKIGYQNSKSENSYQSIILKNSYVRDCFSKNIYQNFFGGMTITAYGTREKGNISNEIKILEKELPKYLINDKYKALQIIKKIGGNVFLIQSINFSLLSQVDKELLKEINKDLQTDNNNGCGGCGCWHTFDDFSDSFDNSCSGESSFGGGNGCGNSDSGCTGCDSSGCGGCGGD